MAFSRFCLIYILCIALLASLTPKAIGGVPEGTQLGFMLRSSCRGSVDECLGGDEDEFELDSESNRRILATKRYISYGALQKNNVPCSRRGASYYNCRPGAQANPYSRGCSAITRCRR
ncbi:hypothetical protein LIER_25169 [Lithospermum erythrorhizon]|uniref:Uncharacterized protein n=1 Tax=Lithospermum erythrorhizon TaxID=34254 RepID=A0AAV3R7G5_LITER